MPIGLGFGGNTMRCIGMQPARGTLAGIQSKLAVTAMQVEGSRMFSTFKGQVTDMFDKEQEFCGKVPHLLGQIVIRTRSEG